MDPNNLNTHNKINTSNSQNKINIINNINKNNTNNIIISCNNLNSQDKIDTDNNWNNSTIDTIDNIQLTSRESTDLCQLNNTRLSKFTTLDTNTSIYSDRSFLANYSPITPYEQYSPYSPYISYPYYGTKEQPEWRTHTEEKDLERKHQQKPEQEFVENALQKDSSAETGTIGMTERRGGLSWIRTSNGTLLPQIENTWLKHIITSLQSNKVALVNFFNNLEKCLIESVHFLYREGIKPYLGDVANQMKRSICDNFWSAAEVAYVSLHCKNAVRLQLELRVKGEMGWVVYLLQEPKDFKGFVDTHSTVNTYTDYYWRQLNQFASSILALGHISKTQPYIPPDTNSTESGSGISGGKDKEDRDFNGGRYAFAERLKNEVDAFKEMRLGEVVHLVQLAIYSGIFVYAQRILLPVAACEKTAQELFPKLKKSRYPICTSIEEVLKIVSLLVDGRKNGLVLAQLKQQFMLQFNRELNPLSFGYRKLQNLLLSDLFNINYHLFVPVDSPHRTHIQHRRYPIPPGCKVFRQSKLQFDPNKFPNPLTDFYDQYFSVCPKHTFCHSYDLDQSKEPSTQLSVNTINIHTNTNTYSTLRSSNGHKECQCMWKIDIDTLPKVVKDAIKDCLE